MIYVQKKANILCYVCVYLLYLVFVILEKKILFVSLPAFAITLIKPPLYFYQIVIVFFIFPIINSVLLNTYILLFPFLYSIMYVMSLLLERKVISYIIFTFALHSISTYGGILHFSTFLHFFIYYVVEFFLAKIVYTHFFKKQNAS